MGRLGRHGVGEDGWEAWWGDAGQRTRQSHPSASQRSTSNHPKTLTRSDDFANKTMVTNKTLKVSNHPPTHPTNQPPHLLDQHFIISRFQSDQRDQVDKEMKLLLPSILLLLGAIGALAAPPLSEGKGQQSRQR